MSMNIKKITAAIGFFILYMAATAGSPQFSTRSLMIYDIAVSPKGEVVFIADENTIKAYSIQTPALIREFSDGHQEAILSLAISPDSSLLASADRNCELIIRELGSGQIVKRFSEHEGRTTSLSFSPCGRYLASGGTDDLLILYSMENMEVLAKYRQQTKGVTRVKFSPDGSWLAGAGAGGRLLLIDMRHPDRQHHLEEARGFIRDLDFSHCGGWLSAVGNKGRIYTWRIRSGGDFSLYSSKRESHLWITSIHYSEVDAIYAWSQFDGQVVFRARFGRYAARLKTPVHKLILLQSEDSSFSLLLATRNMGVIKITGGDMRIKFVNDGL